MIYKIGRLFVKAIIADDKQYLLNRDNLTQPIQMKLSQKQKTFSRFFCAFLKSSLNFEHIQKKDDSHSWGFSKITESEKQDWINVYKVKFQGILQKATWEMLPNIVWICMAEALPYLLIAVKAIDFQKVSLSHMQNLKTVS